MEYREENKILLDEALCENLVGGECREVALNRFQSNIKLAQHIAAKFHPTIDGVVDRDDILQSAYEGLWRACLQYEESRGLAFSTYAHPYIKGYVLSTILGCKAIHTPRYFESIAKTIRNHGFKLPLSDEEVSIILDEGKFTRFQILNYIDVSTISLQSPVVGTEDLLLEDTLPSEEHLKMCRLSEEDMEVVIDRIIDYIKPHYRDIVEEWLYSIVSGDPVSQVSLSIKYGTSRANISRIIKLSIRLVKMHSREIRDMLL